MDLSWITSRSKHPKQSIEAQEEFKKLLTKTIITIPGHMGLDRTDVWFQDEAHFGQQHTATKVWAQKGFRPRAVRQQQFESAYIYGAVCPATGKTEAIIASCLSKGVMRKHLQLVSDATEDERYAVVIVDHASWHMGDIASEFKNLSIIPLPPYSPELNPVEQVWQWSVKGNYQIAALMAMRILLSKYLELGIYSA